MGPASITQFESRRVRVQGHRRCTFPNNFIPDDGRWWDSDAWKNRILGVADDPAVAVRAEQALIEAFPAEWAKALPEHHAFSSSTVWLTGAIDLLELGVALHDLRPADTVVAALRHHDHFANTAFQLWMGHALHRAGATLTADDGRSTAKTPDWIADWPSGRLIVEAKRMGPGSWEHAYRRVDSAVYFAFIRAVGEITENGAQIHVHVQPDGDVYDGCVRGRHPYVADVASAEAAGATLARDARALLERTRVPGVHGIPRGRVEIRPALGGGSSFSFGGHQSDVDREARRVRLRLREALEQAASADPSAPVIFATDASEGVSAHVRFEAARRAVYQDPPAGIDRLAAVIVRDGLFYPDEPLPYTIAWPMLGPAQGEIPEEFVTGFRQCHLGHLHFEPLLGRRRGHKCDPRIG